MVEIQSSCEGSVVRVKAVRKVPNVGRESGSIVMMRLVQDLAEIIVSAAM